MPQPIIKNFELADGDTLDINFVIKDSAGNPQDITNAALTFAAENYNGEGTSPLTKSEGSGITITDAVNGAGTVRVDAGELTAPAGGMTDWHYSIRAAEITDSISPNKGVITVTAVPA